jgi:hypothetical protein
MSAVAAIQTVSDLEAVVTDWEKRFFEPGLGYPPIWYRGQSRDLSPQPGVLRPELLSSCDTEEIQMKPTGQRLWNKERTFNRQFRRMSASLIPAGSGVVSLYFLAQHHGLPTRLMDWTMNPLSALYFAASGFPDDDGVIFAMNPKNLGAFAEMRDSRVERVVSALFGDSDIPFDSTIIPVLPDLFAGRLLQQSSCFTLHTPPLWLNDLSLSLKDDATHKITPSAIAKVSKYVIPKDAKPKLRLTLRRLGVTDATLFPDLDHVASEIKNAWRL